jgi:hypothetical protein
MEYRASIKGIPNTRAGQRAYQVLRVKGLRNTKRGRGARGTRYHQSLPMERASHFTQYTYDPADHTIGGYQYCQYMGTDSNGKIRLRLLNLDRYGVKI